MSLEDLQKYYDENKQIPVDEDQSFVVAFRHTVIIVRENEKAKSVSKFIMVISTPKLLRRQSQWPVIQVDGTYKLMTLNYPLLVCGFSDADKKFFPTGSAIASHEDKWCYGEFLKSIARWDPEKLCKPRHLIADGAAQIKFDIYMSDSSGNCNGWEDYVTKPRGPKHKTEEEVDKDYIFDGLVELFLETQPNHGELGPQTSAPNQPRVEALAEQVADSIQTNSGEIGAQTSAPNQPHVEALAEQVVDTIQTNSGEIGSQTSAPNQPRVEALAEQVADSIQTNSGEIGAQTSVPNQPRVEALAEQVPDPIQQNDKTQSPGPSRTSQPKQRKSERLQASKIKKSIQNSKEQKAELAKQILKGRLSTFGKIEVACGCNVLDLVLGGLSVKQLGEIKFRDICSLPKDVMNIVEDKIKAA